MATYKKRIWPMLCGMILFVILIISVCMAYVATVLVTSVSQDLEKFDDQVGKMAALIKEDEAHYYHLLGIYADYVQQQDESNLFNSMKVLEEISLNSTFEKVGIVNADGAGYLVHGDAIYIAPEHMNGPLFSSQKQLGLNQKLEEDAIIYGVPYYKNHQSAGMIIGIVNPQTAFDVIDKESIETLQAAYLLDNEGQAIISYNRLREELNYQGVSDDQIYSKEKWSHLDESVKRELLESLSQDEIDQQGPAYVQLISQEGIIWYKHVIEEDNGQVLTLMVARKASMSEEVKHLFNQTAQAGSILFSIFFIFLIVMLIANRMAQHRLGMLAYLDMVTGGENWNKLKVDAKKRFRRRRKRNKKYAIVTFDIDHFKLVNDIYGHNKGNQILKDTLHIIKKQLYRKEYVARYSGDVFTALVYYEDELSLEQRIYKWQKALEDSLDTDKIYFSYGIYLITDYSLSLDRMCIYASIARDSVKNERENKVAFFDEALRVKLLKEQEIESQMEEALANKEFKVYLQPKYPPTGGGIGGAEALVRWISPKNGFMSPGDFIPIFEKNAFIIQLDEYMLEEVCKLQRNWLDQGKELVTISVNISRTHLLDEALIPTILRIVNHYELPHECIELELTESAFFDDKRKLIETVNRLKENGFAVSMDDFGSGYSSLNTLKDLPFDVVKLDGEFFRKMEDQARSRIIIEDTITMAKHLKLQIVAEGIEEKEQVDFLKEMGCDLIQGYYFAKPMPVEEFSKLL